MNSCLVMDLLRHAAADPNGPAIVDGATGERLSRAQLAERSAAVAVGLARRGIGRGDLVAVAMPPGAAWVVVALGVWRAGAALAPMSPAWSVEEAGWLLGRVRPRLAVVASPLVRFVRAAGAAAGTVVEVLLPDQLEGGTPDPFSEPEIDPDDLAVVPFSSGTGGLPKGVRLTHGNLLALARQFEPGLRLHEDSVVLAGTPFFHVMGLGPTLCAPLGIGATIVSVPMPQTEGILDLVAKYGVTHTTVPLAIVEEMAGEPGIERHDTSSLELVTTGGAHLPAAVQVRAGERLGCLVRQGYGMTEAGFISGPGAQPSDPTTVGWLARSTEARLVDPESGRDVDDGTSGELWIRGPQVMDGYYDDPEATAQTLSPDGWLRTGDLVRFRDDGQLVIEDRLKELIKVNGYSVAPAGLELLLREHPSVGDAAVVGRPHPRDGEIPVAYVVLSDRATVDELIAYIDPRVAPYRRLRDVRIVDELPRGPSGKLLRRSLRDRERVLTPGRGTRPAAPRTRLGTGG